MKQFIGISILVLIASCSARGQSEATLDSLLENLHNNDIFIGSIVGGMIIPKDALEAQQLKARADSVRGGLLKRRKRASVSSLLISVDELETNYPKALLAKKVYPLLFDPQRDFYAHVILLEFFVPEKLGYWTLRCKADWESRGTMEQDKKVWEAFLKREKLISSEDDKTPVE